MRLPGLTQREQAIRQGLIREADPPEIAFEKAVAGGFFNERGKVEFLFPAVGTVPGYGIIAPDRFPSKRFFFFLTSFEKTTHRIQGRNISLRVGSLIEFDMEPQDIQKRRYPIATNCRMLLPKGKL